MADSFLFLIQFMSFQKFCLVLLTAFLKFLQFSKYLEFLYISKYLWQFSFYYDFLNV